MAFLYDYNGNPIAFEDHTHVFEDTVRPASTPMASATEDGFMNRNDKYYLNTIETDLNTLDSKIRDGVFRKIKPGVLVNGTSFNTTLKSVGPNATSVVFTDAVIPSDKVTSARLVSEATSGYKVYMYLDGTTVYVSPETTNVTIFGNSDCGTMFKNYNKMTSLDLSNFDTSKVTNMEDMFYECNKLTSLDLSNFDTSKVTSMDSMFYNCEALTSLNVTSFNTSNVTNMNNMFNGTGLTSLNISNFNTSNVIYMGGMFYRNIKLKELYLLNFNTSKVTDMSFMFSNCIVLSTLDLSSFDTTKVMDMTEMFYNSASLKGTIITIRGTTIDYAGMFEETCINDNTSITVNYISNTKAIAEDMVSTKSDYSNVFLGTLVV